ncbi:TrmB family transcriptional regulator [Haladaptatus sp. DJG-WS-42]|uniref:helix-turn-helix domain-containing protein n=1 Tax=Haladaptatus sp. DJG-WS-42 TaxID=3120516 RepID=UPI0030D4E3DC
MTAKRAVVSQKRRALPVELESPSSKLVYYYLQTEHGATVEELHEELSMTHISLYPVLRTLVSRGFVVQDGDRYHLLD